MTNLRELRLDDNRLAGAVPSQLGELGRGPTLRTVHLKHNSGLAGCIPPLLREVRFHDLDQLGLPDCPADAPETP